MRPALVLIQKRKKGKNNKGDLGLFECIPFDVLGLILGHLSPPDLERAGAVCTMWFVCAHNWRVLRNVSQNFTHWLSQRTPETFSLISSFIDRKELLNFLLNNQRPDCVKILVLIDLKISINSPDQSLFNEIFFPKTSERLNNLKAANSDEGAYQSLKDFIDFLNSFLVKNFRFSRALRQNDNILSLFEELIFEFLFEAGINQIPEAARKELELLLSPENLARVGNLDRLKTLAAKSKTDFIQTHSLREIGSIGEFVVGCSFIFLFFVGIVLSDFPQALFDKNKPLNIAIGIFGGCTFAAFLFILYGVLKSCRERQEEAQVLLNPIEGRLTYPAEITIRLARVGP